MWAKCGLFLRSFYPFRRLAWIDGIERALKTWHIKGWRQKRPSKRVARISPSGEGDRWESLRTQCHHSGRGHSCIVRSPSMEAKVPKATLDFTSPNGSRSWLGPAAYHWWPHRLRNQPFTVTQHPINPEILKGTNCMERGLKIYWFICLHVGHCLSLLSFMVGQSWSRCNWVVSAHLQ